MLGGEEYCVRSTKSIRSSVSGKGESDWIELSELSGDDQNVSADNGVAERGRGGP